MPAAPATVVGFLAATPRLRAGTLARRPAAIARVHRDRGLPVPARGADTRAVLCAARGEPADRDATPWAGAPLPAKLVRALLLLAAAGLGRAALVGVDVEHLRFTAGGLALTVERPGDAPRQVVLTRSGNLRACPVHALTDWLHGSDTEFGQVFRELDR